MARTNRTLASTAASTVASIAALTLGLAIFAAGPAAAQISDGVVKVGVLTDMTAASSDLAGPGSVIAAQMATEDFGGKVPGKPIVIISADHQTKADIASSIARKWF